MIEEQEKIEKQAEPNTLLQKARAERFWPQEHIAKAVEVSERTVSSWERGTRNPSLETLGKLCKLFSKDPEQLGYIVIDGHVERLSAASTSLSAPQLDPAQSTALPKVDAEASQALPEVGVSSFRHTERKLPEMENIKPPFAQSHSPHLVPTHTDEYRLGMLKRVYTTWIEGVLEQSLHINELIVMNLLERRDALVNPWSFEAQETNVPPRPLPLGTALLQVYDRAGGEVLVLGESGVGKSTLLFDLARHLLNRAEQDPQYRIPVILKLSSWAARQRPFADWLVEVLEEKYDVEPAVAREWVEKDQLCLLLDGLDEVEGKAQQACIKAIEAYKRKHKVTPLVICCREDVYFAQPMRLTLQQAIVVQPLTDKQIEAYLSKGDGQFETVEKALEEDSVLREMVKTPLMLSMVAKTYQGKDLSDLRMAGSLEERRRQVFATYVQHMPHRGVKSRYSLEQTASWLAWLAGQLSRRHQPDYYIERMQPDWLQESRTRQQYQKMVRRCIYGIESVIIAALFAWLRGGKAGNGVGVGSGLLGQLGGGPGNKILGWMAKGIGGGVEGGGSLGIILALTFSLLALLIGPMPFPIISRQACWHGLRKGLSTGIKTGLIISAFCVLIFGFLGGIKHGLTYGIGMGLFSGLLIGLLSGLHAGLRSDQSQIQRHHARSARQSQTRPFLDRLVDGLIMGLCAGFSFGIVVALLRIWLSSAIVYGLIAGLFFCLAFGFGGGCELLGELGTEIKPAEGISWSWQNAGRTLPEHLKKGGLVGLIVAGCVSVVVGCASGLFYGVGYGLRYGAVYGLILGFVTSVAGILTGILNSGWSSHVLSERQLLRPNEGIHRSLRNALFAACLFGPLGGLASGLLCGAAFGLAGGLAGWPILGGGFTIIFSVMFALQFGMIYGGIAWIEHYLLRWYLWRAGHMPWNYVAFLNEAVKRILLHKVRRGYLFHHPLLHDYFTSLDASDKDNKS